MRRDRYQSHEPPYLLYGVLAASVVMNAWMMLDKSDGPEIPEAAAVVAAEIPVTPDEATQTAALAAGQQAEVQVMGQADLAGGWQLTRAPVEHSLARTFQNDVGADHADALSAIYARLFMWDIDLRRHIQRGDQIVTLWRVDGEGQYDMPVAWLKSGKLGRTLKAYRYQAPGDTFASWWTPDGTELSLRLMGGPIEDYEQITALVKGDRKNHAGVDFKAPVGTDIIAPKAGTVTRVNWNVAANGNCVEVRYPDGTLAKFLHLSELKVQAGQHVKPGQVIALSGNTGRSTAPHLHYQLNKQNGQIVDPMEYHGTVRRQLSERGMDGLRHEMATLDAKLGEEVASL